MAGSEKIMRRSEMKGSPSVRGLVPRIHAFAADAV
jgi:hypothetical protein